LPDKDITMSNTTAPIRQRRERRLRKPRPAGRARLESAISRFVGRLMRFAQRPDTSPEDRAWADCLIQGWTGLEWESRQAHNGATVERQYIDTSTSTQAGASRPGTDTAVNSSNPDSSCGGDGGANGGDGCER
jgi:hypothetical protein